MKEINDLAAPQGFQVPQLGEILQLTKGKIKLAVELKKEGYEREIISLLLQVIKPDDFTILSFHVYSLKRIKQVEENLAICH